MDTAKFTHNLPPDFWMKTGIFLLVVVAIVLAVKFFQRSNKLWLGMFGAMVCGIIFFSWIYNRNEPKFLKPIIDRIAIFFPSKGDIRPEAGDPQKKK